MSEEYLIILLPTFLIIAVVMVHQSYESTKAIPAAINNRVDVEFFVMSKCPDAMKCEILFSPSLLKLSSIINFTLSFIAFESESNEFECPHGSNECTGNKQQLCVQNMYSQTTFIKYLQCQTKQFYMIPYNGEQCAKETSNDLINWSHIQLCVTSRASNELFSKSLERTRLASAKKSCTIHMNGQFWCMHDGFWSNCNEGNDERSFIKAICSRYQGKTKPIECETFA